MYPKRLPEPIPGQRSLDAPSALDGQRLVRLHPYVRQCGDEWRKAWLLRSRRLLDYLIVYIAEGSGRFEVGGERFGVGRGDLVWIPPDTPHEMEGFAPAMHVVYAHFDLLYDPRRSHWDACIPGSVLDLRQWQGLMHPRPVDPLIDSWKGRLKLANTAVIGGLLASLCLEHRRAPARAALSIGGLLLQVIGEICRGHAPSGKSSGQSRAIASAAAYIHEHADQELDVGRLAAAVSLSTSHFRKLFRETQGRSARNMHRAARMRRACQMLAYSSMNVSQIADSLGFSTVHNFSRAFRQVTGRSPRRYRATPSAPPTPSSPAT
jgi:AraC-like DNA-binding protein